MQNSQLSAINKKVAVSFYCFPFTATVRLLVLSLIWFQMETFIQLMFRPAWELFCIDCNRVWFMLQTRLLNLAIVAVKCLFYRKTEFMLTLNFQLLDNKFSVSPPDLGVEFLSDFFVTILFTSG